MSATEFLAALPAPRTEHNEPRYFCPECRDEPNGWRLFWCHGKPLTASSSADAHHLPAYACGRLGPHYAHAYTERCGCLSTNPVIAEAKARMVRGFTKAAR